MSGDHDDHVRDRGFACDECHATVISGDDQFIAPDQHVDGTIQTSFPSGMVFSNNECTGACHGEQHNGRNW